MARPLRMNIENGIYHVTNHAFDKKGIVRDDGDRGKWTALLDKVATRREWRVFAWVLLGSGYATVFNAWHNRRGPLFWGRFKGILVEECGRGL